LRQGTRSTLRSASGFETCGDDDDDEGENEESDSVYSQDEGAEEMDMPVFIRGRKEMFGTSGEAATAPANRSSAPRFHLPSRRSSSLGPTKTRAQSFRPGVDVEDRATENFNFSRTMYSATPGSTARSNKGATRSMQVPEKSAKRKSAAVAQAQQVKRASIMQRPRSSYRAPLARIENPGRQRRSWGKRAGGGFDGVGGGGKGKGREREGEESVVGNEAFL